MRIFIFGNINTGKTYLSSQLLALLPQYKHIELDAYRKLYADGSISGEQLAVKAFVHAVLAETNAIVDFTGNGFAAEKLQQLLADCTCKGILLVKSRSIEECIAAIDEEKFQAIPYPLAYSAEQSLAETIETINPDVSLHALTEQWQKHIWQSYEIPFDIDLNELATGIHLEHHLMVERIKRASINNPQINAVIAYGSLGANCLTPYSDLDLFIETPLSAEHVQHYFENLLAKELVHSDLLTNKITLRTTSGLLIELLCGKNIDELQLYFRESQILYSDSCILKGDVDISQQLHSFTQSKRKLSEKSKEIAAELYFLFCSLPKLVYCNDSYKYHFHLSIMQHYTVQLEHLLLGNASHNYLPKQAANNLPDFPWHLFITSTTKIDTARYEPLSFYIIDLFKRLETNNLIESDKYATPQNIHLHRIIS